jgi:hypothetical protein
MKARLVADGRGQDPEMYPDKASPTIAVHSVFAILALCTGIRTLHLAKVDIKGAFIQTPMKGPPVYMRIDEKILQYIINLYPFYKQFVNEHGSIVTKLLKAMYGCVQSSKLWFDLLTQVLGNHGYVHSPKDPCVMRKQVGQHYFFIMIYVDDLLILATLTEIESIRKLLIDKFKTITIEVMESLSYLGMQLSRTEQETTIDMSYYTAKIVEESGGVIKKSTPGTRDTFSIDAELPMLSASEREAFHSMPAKILYLAKRARPDILTVVSFLCTRVTKATEEDYSKLHRLIGYLK